MNSQLYPDQVAGYRENGFLIIENFLGSGELEDWRRVITAAKRKLQ